MVAALLDFNLAPLSMTRDIALLGLLHRAAIGEGPEHFREYFKRKSGSLKLTDLFADGSVSLLRKRSIWGLPKVYNKLGNALSCATVKDFQSLLQERAKAAVAKRLLTDWETFYSPR